MTGTSKEAQVTKKGKKVILDWVPYIHYPVQFQKDQKSIIRTLIDSSNKVYIMTPAYAKKLGLRTWKTDVGAQKIDGSSLDTSGMVITAFQV